MHEPSSSIADLFSRVLQDAERKALLSVDAADKTSAIGGFLVCLNVPEATEFGVDYEVFRTGSKFQGVKFLPLGIHFVLFRSREQEHGIRQGFFIHIERHAQVVVREWSFEKEELGPPRPGVNVENIERAVLSFQLDSCLGPYPKQHLKTWQRLSNFISPSVLKHCGVSFGGILLPGDAVEDTSTTSPTQENVIPYFPDLPRTVRFTSLRKTRPDLVAAARTTYHLDRSERLEELIEEQYGGDWKSLLGELQLSFLLFLQLSSLAAFEQWKELVALLSSCERALSAHLPLFVAFVRLFQTQLKQIPEDFFQDETTRRNFLSPCLVSLLELIDDDEAPEQLRQKARQLRQLLAQRFHWDFSAELETDEFAPVVVSTEELARAAAVHTDKRAGEESPSTTQTAVSLITTQEQRRIQQEEDERMNVAIAAAFLRGA
uniref:AAR2 protein n=1 Tax=Hyaloperonospora arabidopsidis (strain Emoy2) TaxID=559515 RepID=M4BIW4_HYAAE